MGPLAELGGRPDLSPTEPHVWYVNARARRLGKAAWMSLSCFVVWVLKSCCCCVFPSACAYVLCLRLCRALLGGLCDVHCKKKCLLVGAGAGAGAALRPVSGVSVSRVSPVPVRGLIASSYVRLCMAK